jgi:chlorophyll synthase
VALTLGPWGFVAALVGLALAWAYSAPPLRLKRNGWWGNAACGLCYEGLAWVTGAIVMAGGSLPDGRSLALAALYSLGAHGIMTLNDFKSVEGDRRMGIGSLPVRLGEEQAAHMACWMMAAPQFVVVVLLLSWQARGHALAVGAAARCAAAADAPLRRRPARPRYLVQRLGVTLYVAGMLVSAFALRAAAQAGMKPPCSLRSRPPEGALSLRNGRAPLMTLAGSASCGSVWCRWRSAPSSC